MYTGWTATSGQRVSVLSMTIWATSQRIDEAVIRIDQDPFAAHFIAPAPDLRDVLEIYRGGRSNRLLTGREHLQTDVSEPSCRRNRRAIGPRDRVPLTHQYPLASRCLPDTRSDSNRRIVDVDVYAQSVPGVPQRGRRHDGAAAVSRVRRHVRRPHGRSERSRVDRPLGVLGRGDLHRAQGDRAKRMIPR